MANPITSFSQAMASEAKHNHHNCYPPDQPDEVMNNEEPHAVARVAEEEAKSIAPIATTFDQ